MATQCDIGATIHVAFPRAGGVQLYVQQDGVILVALSETNIDILIDKMKEKRELILASVGHDAYRLAFKRLWQYHG